MILDDDLEYARYLRCHAGRSILDDISDWLDGTIAHTMIKQGRKVSKPDERQAGDIINECYRVIDTRLKRLKE